MERSDYTAANRIAWDEAAPLHKEQRFEELLQKFKLPGYNRFDAISTELLKNIGLDGKNIVQLLCNNGRELLSAKNMGGKRCLGVDISSEFLEQARELNKVAEQDCEFIQSDVYEIPDSYFDNFDLVIVTVGALCWIPDLKKFFQIISNLLRPTGHLFVYEMHPALDMFEDYVVDDPPTLQNSYFRTAPFIEDAGLDYFEKSTYKSAPMYCFHHKLSEIFNSCLENNLTIKHFEEYDHDISSAFSHFENFKIKPPLCYSLIARKE
jgi:SAM-dependent methyltransferase